MLVSNIWDWWNQVFYEHWSCDRLSFIITVLFLSNWIKKSFNPVWWCFFSWGHRLTLLWCPNRFLDAWLDCSHSLVWKSNSHAHGSIRTGSDSRFSRPLNIITNDIVWSQGFICSLNRRVTFRLRLLFVKEIMQRIPHLFVRKVRVVIVDLHHFLTKYRTTVFHLTER
jgi:hypothetical protein